jgi:drug/metabolite transporter (DMT)-like permease
MAGNGRPGVSILVALVLLVAGAAIIVVNIDGHPIGVIGGAVTALAGVIFFVRGVATRRTTPEGRRRFFIS